MKKIGLALGGGFARGFAHIGVLKELKKNNIPIHYIAGTSAGAIIGAAYACGFEPEEIEGMALSIDYLGLFDFTVPDQGLILSTNIEKFLGYFTKDKNFNQTRIPLSIVATNLDTGGRVVFNKGNIVEAVMASISVPGVFPPVRKGKYRYVDGGVTDPVPVDLVKEMGADIIIGVDLSIDVKQRYPKGKETNFLKAVKTKFLHHQIGYVKEKIKKKQFRVPKILWIPLRLFARILLRPDKVIKIIGNMFSRISAPEMLNSMYRSLTIGQNELIKAKLKNAKPDIIIKPKFVGIRYAEFDLAKRGIKEGQRVTRNEIKNIKRLI